MATSNQDEFYIGWMAKAPQTFRVFIKKYVLVLLPVVLILACVLALFQKKFGSGSFEFGVLTKVSGLYYDKPVPNVQVVTGKDVWGNTSYLTIPLIGYGKFGADGIMGDIEKSTSVTLNGKWLTLKGTLLYNDGKTLMQIDGNDTPVSKIANGNTEELHYSIKQLGDVTLKGEIIDPKCYFGVMKPGEGKPHMDCAIRCILGGMPPMLHVTNNKGASNYYLIVGPNGEKINSLLKNYIAGPVELQAKAVAYNDWVVLPE
jgi:hypothetical protein